jgi:hypothetical protein
MAVPWPGSFDPASPKLAYNFVHSSARMCIERAWEKPGHGLSPRDPELARNAACEPRESSTQHLMLPTDSRKAATEQMEALGFIRRGKVHWK